MKIPVLALIHPKDPAVVYFFLKDHLFGVDLRSRSVVECEVYELVAPDRNLVATRFVRAWELPPSLSSSSAKTKPLYCTPPDLLSSLICIQFTPLSDVCC